MKYSLIVTWLLMRELLRAALAPVHLLVYLPQRHKWRARAERVLAQTPRTNADSHAVEPQWGGNGDGHIFISAGETSGETHAAKVVRAVGDAGGHATWTGFGGQQLTAVDVDVLYPLSNRAVMGLYGVFQSLPFILGAVRRFLRLLDESPPSLVLLVDYPGLHLILAGLARRRGIPVLHYIAPQYWAWGPWRMRRYQHSVSATLTILPFESAFFEDRGIPSEYVGHPLLDQPSVGTELRADPYIDEVTTGPYLCLLPGSRRQEIELNLPGMLGVARALRRHDPDLAVVLPHVDARRFELIETILREHDGEFVQFRQGSIGPILDHAHLVLAKSGTGALEACLHGTPTVVVYRLPGAFASFFARNCLSVPYIASANLIAGQKVVPEFCFRHPAGWRAVEHAVRELWDDGPARTACQQGLSEVRRRLGGRGASARVARWVLPFCQRAPRRDGVSPGAGTPRS